jgi:hypothetical protein
MTGLTGITALAGGFYHTLALKNDGTLWSVGDNSSYQIGDGTSNNRSSAVKLAAMTGAVLIACGSHHSLAVKSDGATYSWGQNSNGQLGNGATSPNDHPVAVPGLCTVTVPTTTGLAENAAPDRTMIYPNPTAGRFTVFTQANGTTEIRVFNLLGEKVWEGAGHEADLSEAPKGIYLVNIEEGSSLTRHRLIVN